MMKTIYLWTVVAVCAIGLTGAVPCTDAPPSPLYSPELYQGLWYEVAKIQTAGGAYFERNCVCTFINVTYTDKSGDALAYQGCRQKTPSGQLTLVVGNLTAEPGQPGKFVETINTGPGLAVSYTVVQIDAPAAGQSQYAVEYDCGTSAFGVNYCIHYMSRQPTIDPDTLDALVQKTQYLNTLNLPLTHTYQTGCPDP